MNTFDSLRSLSMNGLLFLLMFFANTKSASFQDNIKWAIILALPYLSSGAIEHHYDENADMRERFSIVPAALCLAAWDRLIDQNPEFEKYYIDIVRNGLGLLFVNMLYNYKHDDDNRKMPKRIFPPFEPFFGIMDTPSGQMARYFSLFKFVDFVFKNILKVK